MAVYFDISVPTNGDKIYQIQWHSSISLLAIATHGSSGGILSFFKDEAEPWPEMAVQRPASKPVSISWHPVKPLLAVAWESGDVGIWSRDEGGKVFEVATAGVHTAAVSVIAWTGAGSRLLTGDLVGGIQVWKVDTRGRVQPEPLYGYKTDARITCATLMTAVQQDKDALDISALAKAAVSGDEKALDLMSWKKPKGIKFNTYGPLEACSFYIASETGTLLYLTESGETMSVGSVDSCVSSLLYSENSSALIVATDSGMLTHFQVQHSGTLKEVMKVKLACRTAEPDLTWTANNTLAMALGENMVRMWDISKGDNYTLSMQDGMGYVAGAKINTIAYSTHKKVLAAGTSQGQVAFWTFTGPSSDRCAVSQDDPEDWWQLQTPSGIKSSGNGGVSQLHWGSQRDILAVGYSQGPAFLLSQHVLSAHYGQGGAVVVQTGAYTAFVGLWASGIHQILKTGDQIKGSYTTTEHLLLWNGKQITVNEYSADKTNVLKNIGTFNCDSLFVLLHEQNIYTVETLKIQVRNLQGTVKQLLSLTELEGNVVGMSICGTFLVCCTERGCVKIFDLTRREAKQLSSKFLGDSILGNPRIQSVAVNCAGTMVSAIVDVVTPPVPQGQPAPVPNQTPSRDEPSSKVYVWDVELDTVSYFNLESGLGEQDELDCRPAGDTKATTVKQLRQGRRGSAVNGDDFTSGGGDDKYRTKVPNDADDPDGGMEGSASRSRREVANEIGQRIPVHHYWDTLEPKLLVVEARLSPHAATSSDESQVGGTGQRNTKKYITRQGQSHRVDLSSSFNMPKFEEPQTLILSLFVTQDSGILIQDHFPMKDNHSRLIGVDVPYFYFSVRADLAGKSGTGDENVTTGQKQTFEVQGSSTLGGEKHVARRTMRDFVGMEDAEKTSKEAMMNFSYYLTLGNMDEAFKAMKLIKSESVWHNMARMCVKTRRIDVAGVCLGKMGNARGAMMLRQAKAKIPEPDAQVAVLAMQLGMMEEAERLLKRCNRSDLLNRHYQSIGQWDKAREVSESKDRIHLRSTYYNYAKFQEANGNINGAIDSYTKSETFRFEVPRMLFDTPEMLEKFIEERPDKALHKWWAQYMESLNEMETALKFYESAQDYLSLVRVHCFLGHEAKAEEICSQSNDKAASYHLARQFEAAEKIDQAIHFFSRAQAFSSAIRLCKEHGKDEHLVNLALLSRPTEMIEAANYLERKPGYTDRAVMLYHKAGLASRAVELAFKTKQFGALQQVTLDLTDKTDPALLQKCADFFMNNNQYDRAVDLLAAGKQYWEALKFCVEYNVPLTEDLAEKLTPLKTDRVGSAESTGSGGGGGGKRAMPEGERIRLLEGIAEVCLNQRQYHLACKKYTQAGNRQMAMKALLKSGDTDKVIFFANVSKQKDIYVMAANFLQTVDWRRDPEIMKSIIQFYTRGKALDSLAWFYEACAQVEIDEYQNYEKAMGALGESYKSLSKAKMDNTALQEQRIDKIKAKVILIKKYLTAKSMLDNQSDDALQQLQALLEEPDIDSNVRLGDIYSTMVDHFVSNQKFKAAYACVEEMRRKLPKSTNLYMYVSQSTLETIHSALNMPLPRSSVNGANPDATVPLTRLTTASGRRKDPGFDADEVEDDVEDAIDDDYA